MNIEKINKKLEELAYKRTTPFCYMCYQKAPSGRCTSCHSDDLMRHFDGVGVEYGTSWVIEHIVSEELEAINEEKVFKQMIDDSYIETTQLGFIEVSTSQAIKELDPIAWDIAKGEYISSLLDDEYIIEIGGSYYWVPELESLF